MCMFPLCIYLFDSFFRIIILSVDIRIRIIRFFHPADETDFGESRARGVWIARWGPSPRPSPLPQLQTSAQQPPQSELPEVLVACLGGDGGNLQDHSVQKYRGETFSHRLSKLKQCPTLGVHAESVGHALSESWNVIPEEESELLRRRAKYPGVNAEVLFAWRRDWPRHRKRPDTR